jgi:hypothetical protein
LAAKSIRHQVQSLPFALRFSLAADPNAMTRVLDIVYRTNSRRLAERG